MKIIENLKRYKLAYGLVLLAVIVLIFSFGVPFRPAIPLAPVRIDPQDRYTQANPQILCDSSNDNRYVIYASETSAGGSAIRVRLYNRDYPSGRILSQILNATNPYGVLVEREQKLYIVHNYSASGHNPPIYIKCIDLVTRTIDEPMGRSNSRVFGEKPKMVYDENDRRLIVVYNFYNDRTNQVREASIDIDGSDPGIGDFTSGRNKYNIKIVRLTDFNIKIVLWVERDSSNTEYIHVIDGTSWTNRYEILNFIGGGSFNAVYDPYAERLIIVYERGRSVIFGKAISFDYTPEGRLVGRTIVEPVRLSRRDTNSRYPQVVCTVDGLYFAWEEDGQICSASSNYNFTDIEWGPITVGNPKRNPAIGVGPSVLYLAWAERVGFIVYDAERPLPDFCYGDVNADGSRTIYNIFIQKVLAEIRIERYIPS